MINNNETYVIKISVDSIHDNGQPDWWTEQGFAKRPVSLWAKPDVHVNGFTSPTTEDFTRWNKMTLEEIAAEFKDKKCH